jgi:hypothetical protein
MSIKELITILERQDPNQIVNMQEVDDDVWEFVLQWDTVTDQIRPATIM